MQRKDVSFNARLKIALAKKQILGGMVKMARIRHAEIPHENPVYIGDRPAVDMDLSIITYTQGDAQIKKLSDIKELGVYKNIPGISWVNINGLKDVDAIKYLGELYDIHHLSIEDILNTEQQPKIEIFADYRFLSMKTIQHDINFHIDGVKGKSVSQRNKDKPSQETDGYAGEYLIDQISMILREHCIITIQEIPGDSFDEIRRKILEGIGHIRKMGTDYLAYAIVDSVVDEYYVAMNHLEEDIENFEDRATKTSDNRFITEIQDTKKYLLQIKKAILPLKENIMMINRQDDFFQDKNLKPFLHDLTEHLYEIIATIENHREWLTSIMDLNLSVVSHQMNKVMKVLAIISTIFIPLTFVAGVYGMNFDIMPELHYKFGYPAVLGGMGFIAIFMIIIFKIRKWF
jgi:magnesium transporter